MSDEKKFIDGLIVKAPHERAPEYVIAKISLHRTKLVAWLQEQSGEWINADIKESREGKYYAVVDDWKPSSSGAGSARAPQQPKRQTPPVKAENPPLEEDEIPFITREGIK